MVTGEVAVNLGAAGEGMVAGDAVNTAARVQAAAEPGQVLADSSTQRLAGRRTAVDGLEAPLTGRDAELNETPTAASGARPRTRATGTPR